MCDVLQTGNKNAAPFALRLIVSEPVGFRIHHCPRRKLSCIRDSFLSIMAVYFRFVYKSLEPLYKLKAEIFWDVALTYREAS
jgi:hypothetical protein